MAYNGLIALTSTAAGMLFLAAGFVVPAHLRATDRTVLEWAGKGTSNLVDHAAQAFATHRPGVARLLYQAVQVHLPATPGVEEAQARIRAAMQVWPAQARWGAANPWLDRHVGPAASGSGGQEARVLDWALPDAGRAGLAAGLAQSTHPTVMPLLACRRLERTVLLPPASSASGQPLDMALLVAAALAENGRLHPGLALAFERAATQAERGGDTMPLESGLLDLLAMMRRMDWEQMATVTERCEDLVALHGLVSASGMDGQEWANLFAAVTTSGSAREVAYYAERHGKEGMADLASTFALGDGAVRLLLERGWRVHDPTLRSQLMKSVPWTRASELLLGFVARSPRFGVALKYLLWADGLLLLLIGISRGHQYLMIDGTRRESRPPNLGFQSAMAVAGTVFLCVALEPFLSMKTLAPEIQSASFQPVLRARLRIEAPPVANAAMNVNILGMLIAFFAIQFVIYLVGLSRLRSIRTQLVESATKLRLLDNEESMFDAPLYLGIAGSVLALVLRLTGFGDVSLMASYSSTLFGILFCFILKVMHVRPYRQQLILESTDDTRP
ncbi:MAG: hypothetical protein JNK85_17900 [Verrucomicrobiales bacterium]|nr:hypothetical protein [Verrucomicrobiales bacterium]